MALSQRNRNDRSTALGRLCWVSREAGKVVADLLSAVLVSDEYPREPDPERDAAIVQRVKSAVASLRDALGSDEGLPSTARAFWGGVVAATAQADEVMRPVSSNASHAARERAFERLSRAFDFEEFPGATDFVAEARAQPDVCPDI